MAAELFGAQKIVDCSHVIDENTFSFMGVPLNRTAVYTVEEHGFGKDKFELGCDVGAHLDSPGHFILGGRLIDELTPEELTARAAVIDVTSKVEAQADGNYGLTVEDIQEWEAKFGEIPARSLIVMKTGWDARMGTPSYVNFDSEAGAYYFPGFLPEASQWLLDNRDIVGLAIDTPSTDIGTSTEYGSHLAILGADKFNLENLTLAEVPEGKDSVFVALPVNIKDAPETPVRVMAIVGMSAGTYILTASLALIATMLAL